MGGIAVAIVILLVVAIFMVDTFGYAPTAKLLPQLVGAATLGLLALNVVGEVLTLRQSRQRGAPRQAAAERETTANRRRWAVAATACCLFTPATYVLGFGLGAFAIFVIVSWALGLPSKPLAVISAGSFALALYFIFKVWLGVPLPGGVLLS